MAVVAVMSLHAPGIQLGANIYPALGLVQLGGHTAGTAEASLLLLLPSIGWALERGLNIEHALGRELLSGHELVGLRQEKVLWKTCKVVRIDDRTSSLIYNRELDIDDGLDTKTILNLRGDVLLKLLLEDVSLDVQAVAQNGRSIGLEAIWAEE